MALPWPLAVLGELFFHLKCTLLLVLVPARSLFYEHVVTGPLSDVASPDVAAFLLLCGSILYGLTQIFLLPSMELAMAKKVEFEIATVAPDPAHPGAHHPVGSLKTSRFG